jgi:hypothetical protein
MRLWRVLRHLCPGEERSFAQDLLALFGPLLRSDPQLLPMSVRLANFMNKKLVKGGFVPNLDIPKSKMHLFPRYEPAFFIYYFLAIAD